MPVNVIAPLPVETVASAASVVAPATLKALFDVVEVPASVTSSPYCWPPLVVTDWRLVVPPASVVRLRSAVTPPTTPPNVVMPGELTVRLWGPSTAAANVIAEPATVRLLPIVT